MTWHDDLAENGIMMRESDVITALTAGVNEKAALAETTVTIQESNFCTTLDTAICALGPLFVNGSNEAYGSTIPSLCAAAGFNTAVYGAGYNTIILQNGGVRFNSTFVAQRKAILDLFITVGTGSGTDPGGGGEVEPGQTTTITIASDHIFVNKLYPTCTIDPANATTSLEWVVDKDKNGTHFSSNELTFDSNGVVTIHDAWVNETPVFEKVVDSVSDVSSNWLTFNYTGIKGWYCPPMSNVLAKLVAAYQGSYTQSGITLTHNSDGTITLNGTSEASGSTYLRFVIWPIGNNKAANNIPLIAANEHCKNIAWAHPVVDMQKGVSTLTVSGNEKTYEVYFMSYSTQIGTKIERVDAAPEHAYAVSFDNTKTTTAVVLGLQLTQGTVLDNVTLDVGIQAFPDSNFVKYGGELANQLACDDVMLHKTDATLNLIVRCFHNGKFNIWSRGYNFNISTLYYRITESIVQDSTLSNLVTSNSFGIVGHEYQLDMHVGSGEWQNEANKTQFGILLIDDTGAIIAATYAIDHPSATGIHSISDQTFSSTFTLDRPINAAVLCIKSTRQRSSIVSFDVTLTDITNSQPGE